MKLHRFVCIIAIALVVANLGYLLIVNQGIAACPIPWDKQITLAILAATALAVTVGVRFNLKIVQTISLDALWIELGILTSNVMQGYKLPITEHRKLVGVLIMGVAVMAIGLAFGMRFSRKNRG